MYLITPDPADLATALEAWEWIGLEDMTPVAVTAFGDVFLVALSGIWFLDKLEGTLTKVCGSREELAKLLQSADGQNHYLAAGLVQRAAREGMTLGPGECYDFEVAPVLGGAMSFENIVKRDLVTALGNAGRAHEKLRKGAQS